ncbi:MAG: outer membrane beta-barrel family protein, partial [Paramuribaculum sp.]|nr:outer membrane beta-barrel family protein [Paramuribaculum sp.]
NLNIGGDATLGVNYNYSFSDERNSDMRYLLNELDSMTLANLSFAQIPSLQLLDGVIDPENSHRQKYRENAHIINFTARYSTGQRSLDKPGGKGFIYFYANPKPRVLNRSLNYSMIGYDTIAVRRFVVPEVSARLNYAADTHNQTRDYFTSLSWESVPQLFSMRNLIDVFNTTDPLNIYRGNPNLKSGYRHSGSAEFTFTKRKNKYMRHGISFRDSLYTGSVVSGTIYDPVTGVRTSSVYNVDGERGIRVSYNGGGDIVKWENRPFKSLSYNAALTAESGRSVRMIATSTNSNADNMVRPETTFTYSKSLNPSAGLTVRFGSDHNIGISGSGFFNHYHGEDFDEFSAADYNFGINGSFSLPRSIRLSTSLKVVGHSGYADSVMN